MAGGRGRWQASDGVGVGVGFAEIRFDMGVGAVMFDMGVGAVMLVLVK